jgi:hypothetical protein
VIIEGDAMNVTDVDRIRRLAEAFTVKYDDFFQLREVDGRLGWAGAAEQAIEGRRATSPDSGILAFEVRATKAFGFAKGDTFSQTRWRFPTD